MKALVLQDIDQLELAEVPIPEIQPDELLVRTGASTICTSDVHDIHENPFGIQLPVVLGHEGAGTVTAVGAAVQGFKPGDRIATHPVHPCRKCRMCIEGLGHLCLEMGHFGFNMPGTMAEFYRARQDRVRLIPCKAPFHVAALTEPVCVCLEALQQARLAEGANLLIIGDGPFGVLMARLAARLPLARVVLAGQIEFRLSFAPQNTRLNTRHDPDPVRAMLDEIDGAGYEAAILAVSSQKAFGDGLRCLRPRGRLVVFSALPGMTPVDLMSVHLRELEIVGACSDQNLFDQAVALLDDPSLSLHELVSHHFRLEDFREAFKLAEYGKDEAMKVAFTFQDEDY
jgi:threonine dehydrogenase-like Zn-dependent dehydrogenase